MRDDEEIIFARFRRDPRTGKVLDAYRYGIKAWPIRIRRPKTESPERGR